MTLVTVAMPSVFPPLTPQASSVTVVVSQDGLPDVEISIGASPLAILKAAQNELHYIL